MLEVADSCISCCWPRRMFSERRGEAFISQEGDNACQVNEGAIATNHNAATGDRVYHNICLTALVRTHSYAFFYWPVGAPSTL